MFLMTGYKEKKDCLGESIVGINFEYYKVFYYVARYGNITTAAKALFLSQSTVSRMIQNLEHDLETAKQDAADYLQVLQQVTVDSFQYPEA